MRSPFADTPENRVWKPETPPPPRPRKENLIFKSSPLEWLLLGLWLLTTYLAIFSWQLTTWYSSLALWLVFMVVATFLRARWDKPDPTVTAVGTPLSKRGILVWAVVWLAVYYLILYPLALRGWSLWFLWGLYWEATPPFHLLFEGPGRRETAPLQTGD